MAGPPTTYDDTTDISFKVVLDRIWYRRFLQDHPFSFRSNSFSLVNATPDDDPAHPKDEVLTIAKDTPVE
mgnify:CR=1 FL=1